MEMSSLQYWAGIVAFWIGGMCLDRIGVFDGISSDVLFLVQVACIAVIGIDQLRRWQKSRHDDT